MFQWEGGGCFSDGGRASFLSEGECAPWGRASVLMGGGGFRKKLWDGGEGVVHPPPHAPYYGKPWKGGILEKGGVWVDLKKGV